MSRLKSDKNGLKIPAKVRIKARVSYEVVWQERIADDDHCLGLCDPSKRIIYLRLNMSPAETFKTFLHELLHAISAEHDFELPHRTVYSLEEGIFRILRLNKLF